MGLTVLFYGGFGGFDVSGVYGLEIQMMHASTHTRAFWFIYLTLLVARLPSSLLFILFFCFFSSSSFLPLAHFPLWISSPVLGVTLRLSIKGFGS